MHFRALRSCEVLWNYWALLKKRKSLRLFKTLIFCNFCVIYLWNYKYIGLDWIYLISFIDKLIEIIFHVTSTHSNKICKITVLISEYQHFWYVVNYMWVHILVKFYFRISNPLMQKVRYTIVNEFVSNRVRFINLSLIEKSFDSSLTFLQSLT